MRQSEIDKYCDLMAELKRRAVLINGFLSGASLTTYKATGIELVYLQFRKTLELIAMSSLVSNQSAYSAAYSDFTRHWNAERLLHCLEQINPDFYPRPIIEVESQKPGCRMEWLDRADGFLTKGDFVKLYKKCGAIMHTSNPYGSQIDYKYYEESINGWHEKIVGLLNCHTIKLVDDPNIYLIHMQEEDDLVHHYIFVPK